MESHLCTITPHLAKVFLEMIVSQTQAIEYTGTERGEPPAICIISHHPDTSVGARSIWMRPTPQLEKGLENGSTDLCIVSDAFVPLENRVDEIDLWEGLMGQAVCDLYEKRSSSTG